MIFAWELFWIVVVLVVFFGILPLATDLFGAPWAPTSRGIVREMLSMADIKPDEVVYDLGSGDGRIILTAARKFHAKSVGIDINPLWVFWARLAVTVLGLRHRTRVVWGNFFVQDLSRADVVTLYLVQATNDKLKSKLEEELRPGARVVSHVFPFNGWSPLKVDAKSHVYMYKMGESENHNPAREAQVDNDLNSRSSMK